MKSLLSAALLAGLLSAPMFGQGLINRRAPSFSLPDSSFTQFDILDYRGKWLLIEFMSTKAASCTPCRDLTKRLDALKKKHAGKLEILGILSEPGETQDTVKAYIKDTATAIPMVYDLSSIVAMAYFKATPARPAFDVPHIFAVNPQGTIVRDWNAALAAAPAFPGEIDLLVASAAEPAKEAPKAAPKATPAKK